MSLWGQKEKSGWSRRDAVTFVSVVGSSTLSFPRLSSADQGDSVYRQAKRPTAYRVDSTIPPTLQSVSSASRQASTLAALGRGSGTDKEAIVLDTVNLNNMLNKAVFGSIDAVSTAFGTSDSKKAIGGPNYSSYVCMGIPQEPTPDDIELTVSLSQGILQGRKKETPTALGLAGLPYSTQSSLSQLKQGQISVTALQKALADASVPQTLIDLYSPLFILAESYSLQLIALSPEFSDLDTVRRKGIQFVDADRRVDYVVDPQGFIDTANDSLFKLYADRSLFKDFTPQNGQDAPSSFLFERMLVHEAAATAVAKFGYNQDDALCLLITPVADVRFLQGINGRIPRVVRALNPDTSTTENAVTTILCNPTAKDTLSKSNFLRLEIGTGPDSLNFQQKVADYLWFSQVPKVNVLPRIMN